MAEVDPAGFDWNKILKGASWFHVTGITAAISQAGADLTLAAVEAASSNGITVSCDTSYRSKLWQYGKEPIEVMPAIAEHVNVLFANGHDCSMSYGVELGQKLPNDIDEDAMEIPIRKHRKLYSYGPIGVAYDMLQSYPRDGGLIRIDNELGNGAIVGDDLIILFKTFHLSVSVGQDRNGPDD